MESLCFCFQRTGSNTEKETPRSRCLIFGDRVGFPHANCRSLRNVEHHAQQRTDDKLSIVTSQASDRQTNLIPTNGEPGYAVTLDHTQHDSPCHEGMRNFPVLAARLMRYMRNGKRGYTSSLHANLQNMCSAAYSSRHAHSLARSENRT